MLRKLYEDSFGMRSYSVDSSFTSQHIPTNRLAFIRLKFYFRLIRSFRVNFEFSISFCFFLECFCFRCHTERVIFILVQVSREPFSFVSRFCTAKLAAENHSARNSQYSAIAPSARTHTHQADDGKRRYAVDAGSSHRVLAFGICEPCARFNLSLT